MTPGISPGGGTIGGRSAAYGWGTPTIKNSGVRWRIGGSLMAGGGAVLPFEAARGGSPVTLGCGGTAESLVPGTIGVARGEIRGPGVGPTGGSCVATRVGTCTATGTTGGSAVTGTAMRAGFAMGGSTVCLVKSSAVGTLL